MSDKTSFELFNIFRALKSCAMNAKSNISLRIFKTLVIGQASKALFSTVHGDTGSEHVDCYGNS